MYFSRFSYWRYILSLCLMCASLSSYGYILSIAWERETTVDTLYVIDNSLSMAVEDIRDPSSNIISSRLETAKDIAREMIRTTPWRWWAIVYARDSAVISPLISDTSLLESTLSQISPVLDNGGSDVASVFSLINTLYTRHGNPLHIVLFTDGGDTSTLPLPDIIPQMDLTIIGIGTDTWGPVPLGYDALGNRRYKIYQWKEISVPYDAKNIEKLTTKYSASYHRVESLWFSLEGITPETSRLISVDPPTLTYLSHFALFVFLISVFLHPYARITHHA